MFQKNKEDGTRRIRDFPLATTHAYPPTQERENEREIKDIVKVLVLNHRKRHIMSC